MRNIFFGGGWYNPERDGTLEEYLTLHDGHSSFPLFRGYSQFKLLVDEGYILPEWSAIRLMWNVGRDDEHFFIDENFQLVGCDDLRHHAGRPGTFDPEEFLERKDLPPWEAHNLNRNPARKKQ
jgi:hypothetical protein